MSREIVDSSGLVEWLVVAGGVEGEFADELALCWSMMRMFRSAMRSLMGRFLWALPMAMWWSRLW